MGNVGKYTSPMDPMGKIPLDFSMISLSLSLKAFYKLNPSFISGGTLW